jgi:hypothetical protein
MQQIEQRRAAARNLRYRSSVAHRGWPQFYAGLALFLAGLGITIVTYVEARHGGVMFVMFGFMALGLIQMARGLGSLSTMKKLDAAQAPLSHRQQWLLAPAAFAADGAAAEPGWLADPLGSDRLRFWDGQNWTGQIRSATNIGFPE